MKFLIAFFIALSLTIAWQTVSLAKAEGSRKGGGMLAASAARAATEGGRPYPSSLGAAALP